jgi:hypothetical protein
MDTSIIAAHRTAVDAVITANPGVPVLMYWYDLDEEMKHAYDGPIKFKWPFELPRFAVGTLTGLPIYDEPWGVRHTKWFLPVLGFHACDVTTSELRWEKSDRYPQYVGGTYPSLEPAEVTGYNPEVMRSIVEHRRAQIIVSEDNIRTWLESHEDYQPQANKWFGSIMRHSGAAVPA